MDTPAALNGCRWRRLRRHSGSHHLISGGAMRKVARTSCVKLLKYEEPQRYGTCPDGSRRNMSCAYWARPSRFTGRQRRHHLRHPRSVWVATHPRRSLRASHIWMLQDCSCGATPGMLDTPGGSEVSRAPGHALPPGERSRGSSTPPTGGLKESLSLTDQRSSSPYGAENELPRPRDPEKTVAGIAMHPPEASHTLSHGRGSLRIA